MTGPRQSGKTTLCRAQFPEKPYVSLEELDRRQHAIEDPREFLRELADGAIIDEVQRAPTLLSYLQVDVDERPEPGRFALSASISQSLAGRTAVLELLPLGYRELQRFASPPQTLLEVLFSGSYPRIHDRGIPPARWLQDYVSTYVQRDVRQMLDIGNLSTFTTFLKMAAEGHAIAGEMVRSMRQLGFEAHLHLPIQPAAFDQRELGARKLPILRKGKSNRSHLARWLRETGGIAGEPYKVRVESLPRARRMRAIEAIVARLEAG